MIIGTAGHIDHGKSALVTALTGRPMDRLAEERRRGITIDLNFAPLRLAGLPPVGLVDVPGHEDFVRTMVAGASGIDLLLLVIDAAEGIRPQTVEHLTVAEQLGIPRGIPVVTKADLVEQDWLELMVADVSARLAASPVAFDPPIVTSATTGFGVDGLRDRIAALVATSVSREEDDLFRLPVDRVFALAGIGTVVTGTVWSGKIRVGDQILVLPEGLEGRVRSAECYGAPVEEVHPGTRTALGVTGVSRHAIRRGANIVTPGTGWAPTTLIDATIRLAKDAPKPLRTRERVRLHHGTAEVMARVYPREVLSPGGSATARITLEAPLTVRGGDRFVLRRYSPMITIGGGEVLDPMPPRRAAWVPGMDATSTSQRCEALISRRRLGVAQNALPVLIGLSPSRASALVSGLPRVASVDQRWVSSDRVHEAENALRTMIERFHDEDPSSEGISTETLRSGLGSRGWLANHALSRLASAGHIRIAGALVALADFEARAGGGEVEVGRLVEALRTAGLDSPPLEELEQQGFKDLAGALRIAASRGLVVSVDRTRYCEAGVLQEFLETVRQVGAQRGGAVIPADLREATGLSRRILIPLLEWSDRQGVTRRDAAGDRRLV